MPITSGTRVLNITLLTVCLDEETLDLAGTAAKDRHWAVMRASFDGYISAKRRPHFGDHLRAGDGCLALIDFDKNPTEAVAAATYLQQVFAGHIVLAAVSRAHDSALVLLAMRAGCTEFLIQPTYADFTEALRRLEGQLAHRSTTPSSGSIFAFVGAKGGVGTTTIAVHLATFLTQKHHKRVLLIDNHAQFGHVCIYLGLDGSGYHVQDLVRNVNRLDSELIRGFVATHPSGLDVLSSPDVGHDVRGMHPSDVGGALEFLRSEYDFVLVDCADNLDDINRMVVASAEHVYVIATPEIGAIRDLSRYCDELAQLDGLTSKVKVVINRYSSQFAIDIEEIEKAIRLPVSFSIPNSYIELVRSANLGIPLTPDSKSGFCQELSKWADSLTGASAPAAETQDKGRNSKGFFGWLKRDISTPNRAGMANAGGGA